MPKTFPKLLDLMAQGGNEIATKAVMDVAYAAPVLMSLPSRTIKGLKYTHRRITGVPKIRPVNFNDGVVPRASDFVFVEAECFPYQGLVVVDKKMAKVHPGGRAAATAEEADNHMYGALFAFEQGLMYGSKLGLDGMLGFPDVIGDYMTISADPEANTEETKKTGGTSCWAVVADPDSINVLWGASQQIELGQEESHLVAVGKDKDKKLMPAWTREVSAFPGLEVKKSFLLVHLQNIDEDHPMTDKLMDDMMDVLPANMRPSAFIMNRKGISLLRQQRTATIQYLKGDGATSAPQPDEHAGIPIMVTDAIINDETPENIKALGREIMLELEKNKNLIKR